MTAFVQTVRHRDYFLPVALEGRAENCDEHLEPPSNRTAWTSLGLLLVSLVAVVGLAKAESAAIEAASTSPTAPRWPASAVVHPVIFAAFLFVAVIP